mmetsp:Transcript_12622/g.20571  ORF Transcript_12622/g.20571 Transcript_12622/m.20571 type:complete len:87 (-) Transcript_12622:34-294(-)
MRSSFEMQPTDLWRQQPSLLNLRLREADPSLRSASFFHEEERRFCSANDAASKGSGLCSPEDYRLHPVYVESFPATYLDYASFGLA